MSAEADVTNTMAPAFVCSTINRATDCVKKYGPCRFVRMTSSKLLSLASNRSARTRGARPALFTSASSVPYREIAEVSNAARSCAFPMSARQ